MKADYNSALVSRMMVRWVYKTQFIYTPNWENLRLAELDVFEWNGESCIRAQAVIV